MDTHANTEEENTSKMGAYVGDQTRPAAAHNNFKRSKLQPTTTNYMESLPKDVVFDILVRVPARDINNAARLVCRKWYQTTRTHDFVRAHLQQSTCGLLIQHSGSASGDKTLVFGRGIIEIYDYKSTGHALSSCNGLILERQKEPGYGFRITNPATKQHLDLPSFAPADTAFYNSALAFAAASNEYKVVLSFFSESGEVECAILTVGVDKDWKRLVDTHHLSPTAKKLLRKCSLSTEGFVHWAQDGSSYVLTLNVETEIITQFPALPPSFCGCDHGKIKILYHYLPMGSCLSLLIAGANHKFPILDQVWVMKPESGEWTKVMSIDLESQKRALQRVSALDRQLRPVCWLKSLELLVFVTPIWSGDTEICIAYNVHTHEIESLELGFFPYTNIVHRNSLVWLD